MKSAIGSEIAYVRTVGIVPVSARLYLTSRRHIERNQGVRPDCYACRLLQGVEPLPGGRIHATNNWVVEHCTGPLGVGTLVVKPFRHCVHAGDLTVSEAQEIGPLLQRVSQVVQTVTRAEQVYICLWSHSGWQPVHIDFVVQPAWNGWSEEYDHPGPFVQAAMFRAGNTPPVAEVEKVCRKMKKLIRVLSR
jgi:diadenosine tetraphosphate (Ap4A) HIT family hydrolase